jgi:hypothetical protein
MAGTYGEPGKNPFTTPGVGGILSPVVNSTTGITQVYRQGAAGTFQSLGTYNPSTGKFTPDANNITTTEAKSLSNQIGLTNIKNSAISTAKAAGATQTQAQTLLSPRAASTPPQPTPQSSLTPPLENLETQFTKVKDIKYGILRYPIKQTKQNTYDFLKIDVLKYVSSSLIQGQNQISLTRPSDRLKEILGTVILPMQPNISDSNGVSWNEDQLNALQGAFGAIAYRGISSASNIQTFDDLMNALKSGGSDLLNTLGTLANDPGMSSLISGFFAGQAVGANVLARATGAVINNNLELLFHGPKLRTFRYSYKFTPREPEEATEIKKIIRMFKREMSTSQSDTGLFLQTPNVFKLKYIYNGDNEGKGTDHPYLNVIKPCALTNFNVNYTPDGTYMTYAEGGSMTSYQVDMEFSELEPIYKGDYDKGEGTQGMGY